MHSRWWVVEETEYHITLRGDAVEVTTPTGVEQGWWIEAYMRWDGCVDFRRAWNTPFPCAETPDVQYIHICDILDMIALLTELRTYAPEHFE